MLGKVPGLPIINYWTISLQKGKKNTGIIEIILQAMDYMLLQIHFRRCLQERCPLNRVAFRNIKKLTKKIALLFFYFLRETQKLAVPTVFNHSKLISGLCCFFPSLLFPGLWLFHIIKFSPKKHNINKI